MCSVCDEQIISADGFYRCSDKDCTFSYHKNHVEQEHIAQLPKVSEFKELKFECSYRFDNPSWNNWFFVTITHVEGLNFVWKNRAMKEWTLTANVNQNDVITSFNVDEACPYFLDYKVADLIYKDRKMTGVRGPNSQDYDLVENFTDGNPLIVDAEPKVEEKKDKFEEKK